jgi:hypothetical protein
MTNVYNKWKDKISSNWNKTRQDPYIAVKMNYRAVKYMIIFICGLIAVNIITAIINMNGKSSAMSLLVRFAMVLVGFFIIQRMYFGVLNPLKKTLEHYELNPIKIKDGSINEKINKQQTGVKYYD